MRITSRKVNLPYDIVVYATELSADKTTAYYYKSEALKYNNNIVAITLMRGMPITLVVNTTDNGVGINESIEINSSRIKYIDGEYRYE